MAKDGTAVGAYQFGEFRLEVARHRLLRRGEPAPLPPKAFDTLHELVRRHGDLVAKDELMRAVWADAVVEENNLSQNIAALRRVLHDPRGANHYIQTVPGRGFRFVADVAIVEATPTGEAGPLVLAVLPFENLSADPEREYWVDGLTEETISALGQVDPPHLVVIGRSSVMAYKQRPRDVARAGVELGAAYVVEGSLRTEGGRLRSTAHLVRTVDRTQVWSGSFDSEPRSVLDFQRELAGAIAQQVRLELEPKRVGAIARRYPPNAEAFDAYLRGRYCWHQLSPPTTRRALELYGLATRLDPDYALAWSGIADAHSARPITGDAAPSEAAPPARLAVANAIRAKPDLAEAQASQGFFSFWLEWDWATAERAYRRAIELDPGYSFSHRMLGMLSSHLGRVGEALALLRRARELEPMLAGHHALSAQVAYAARDYPLAAQFARQALAIDPDFWIGHFQLAKSSAMLGDVDASLASLADAGRTSGGNSKAVALRGYLCARHGRVDEAAAALAMLEATSRERYVPACAVAQVHAGLGNLDAVATWVERAYAERDVHLLFIPVDEMWDEAMQDRRIATVVERVGLPTH